MLTRHAPLHVLGRAEVGWLVGESGGLPPMPTKTGWPPGVSARYVTSDGRNRSGIDPSSVRGTPTKKSPRADPPDQSGGPPRPNAGRPRPQDNPQPVTSLTGIPGRLHGPN